MPHSHTGQEEDDVVQERISNTSAGRLAGMQKQVAVVQKTLNSATQSQIQHANKVNDETTARHGQVPSERKAAENVEYEEEVVRTLHQDPATQTAQKTLASRRSTETESLHPEVTEAAGLTKVQTATRRRRHQDGHKDTSNTVTKIETNQTTSTPPHVMLTTFLHSTRKWVRQL